MSALSVQSIIRRTHDRAAAQALAQSNPNLTDLEARLLAARGERAGQKQFSDLLGMSLAGLLEGAQRISAAIDANEQITVVADYDCDGATSCAVVMAGLLAMGARIDYVVPDRLVHGYGISPSVVDLVREVAPGTRVIVTVDNGIMGHSGINHANSLGIDVVVTDHHLPGETLPDACAIINPSRAPTSPDLQEMAGVGVAVWLMRAVRDLRANEGKTDVKLNFLLPYLAIGTVADLVPIGAANRALVNQGLRMLRAGRAPVGLTALMAQSGIAANFLTTMDIGFGLAPRLNAAGRLASMRTGIDLLLATDPAKARQLAETLSNTNEERKAMQREAVEKAGDVLQTLDGQTPSGSAIVAYDPEWHAGIIGLVASKLKEVHYRPAFAFSMVNGHLKGSGRSVPGFHLKDALEEVARRVPGVFAQFGGHAMAAGATLAGERALEDFTAAFCAVAKEWLTPQMLNRELASDGPLPKDLDFQAGARLLMHPWGQRFEPPAFDDVARLSDLREMGGSGQHWRANALIRSTGQKLPLVLFNQPQPPTDRDVPIYLSPSLNTWRETTSLQWIATVLADESAQQDLALTPKPQVDMPF